MKKWLKWLFSQEENRKPADTRESASRDTKAGMYRVMERVDKQIGRAVTRLSER